MTHSQRKPLLSPGWTLAFLIFAGMVGVIFLLAYLGFGPVYRLTQAHYADKIGHFTLYGMLGLLAHKALRERWWHIGPLPLPPGPVIIVLLAAAEEALQTFSSIRNASLKDLAADMVGITLFVLADWLLSHLWRMRKQPPRRAMLQ